MRGADLLRCHLRGALVLPRGAAAQLPDEVLLPRTDTLSLRLRELDTLPLYALPPDDRMPQPDWRPPMAVPDLPSIRIDLGRRPARIHVLNNIILQVGGYVNISNGQAWIWSPYPNGYLDARTLSFPMPR